MYVLNLGMFLGYGQLLVLDESPSVQLVSSWYQWICTVCIVFSENKYDTIRYRPDYVKLENDVPCWRRSASDHQPAGRVFAQPVSQRGTVLRPSSGWRLSLITSAVQLLVLRWVVGHQLFPVQPVLGARSMPQWWHLPQYVIGDVYLSVSVGLLRCPLWGEVLVLVYLYL